MGELRSDALRVQVIGCGDESTLIDKSEHILAKIGAAVGVLMEHGGGFGKLDNPADGV